MAFVNIKNFFKSKFPKLSNKLILLRDSNFISRSIKNFILIDLKKKIYGKKIVSKEKGFLLDFTFNNFVSHTIRPKEAKNIIFDSQTYDNSDTAIIIQGSLNGVANFTTETIEMYLKLFKNTKLILSIWDDEINESLRNQYSERIHILINKKPNNLEHNVDLQVISTNRALHFAKELNIKYCLKTRTDSRIYNGASISYLKNLIRLFPISKKYEEMKTRIISCSMETRKFRVYGLSDIMLFGETDNLLRYFNLLTFKDSLNKYFSKHPCLIKDTAVINEIFLCARYLKLLNIEIDWTLENWWKICSEIFCIVDHSTIDFFWFKYHWKYEQRLTKNFTTDSNEILNFSDWLEIYSDKNFLFDLKKKETWKIQDGNFV